MSSGTNEPLRRYFYLAQRQMFEEIGNGRVRVSDENGRTGVFTYDGHFIEGDLTTVNTHMLMYVGGPGLPKDFNYRWVNIDVDIDRTSGWPEHLERQLSQRKSPS